MRRYLAPLVAGRGSLPVACKTTLEDLSESTHRTLLHPVARCPHIPSACAIPRRLWAVVSGTSMEEQMDREWMERLIPILVKLAAAQTGRGKIPSSL
ncbi:unnamed protein product [Gadus morhua 'NCC']